MKITYRFGEWLIDTFGDNALNLYWSDKNTMSPFSMGYKSPKKVWIKCQNTLHPDYCISAGKFVNGQRCALCSNRKIVPGVNTIKDTHPEFIQFFVDKDDASRYSIHSSKRTFFRCPKCGSIKESSIDKFFRSPYSCRVCGDGASYAEKYVMSFLKQLNLGAEIKREYCIHTNPENHGMPENFSGKRYYDFYIDTEIPVIIEAHGVQHYQSVAFSYTHNSMGLSEVQQNDELKRDIALKTGILRERYVVLDCRYSDSAFIKKSIMTSSLPQIFKFCESDINWDKCAESTAKSSLHTVCELWNSGIRSFDKISELSNVSRTNVFNFLQRGDALGLCEYTPVNRASHLFCMDKGFAFYSKFTCSHLSENIFGFKITSDLIPNKPLEEVFLVGNLAFKYIGHLQYNELLKVNPAIVFDDRDHSRI